MNAQQDKYTQNLNGRKVPIPYEDIINEMKSKVDEPISTRGVDYEALLAKARVLPTDTIDEDPVCLAIEKDGTNYVIGTMGNITTIAGRAKAKKTFAVSFAVAAAVASLLVLNRIKGMLPVGKQTVLLFDTEQSRHHVLKVVKRICRLCGIVNPPNLIVYSLRPFSPEDRLKAVDFAINNTPGLGLAVIDGVRDLAVDPVLDSEQASRIMTHLLQWSDQLNIHIMCVLHQNKNDTNLRGHLGTELVNKSETVISVTRDKTDKEISLVEAEYSRNREFEPFCFTIDENGLPQLIDDEGYSNKSPESNKYCKQAGKSNLPTADNMPADIMNAIIDRAFKQDPHLAFSQLLTNIKEASQHAGATLSNDRARSFIQRVLIDGKVSKFRPEKARWDFYRITNEQPV